MIHLYIHHVDYKTAGGSWYVCTHKTGKRYTEDTRYLWKDMSLRPLAEYGGVCGAWYATREKAREAIRRFHKRWSVAIKFGNHWRKTDVMTQEGARKKFGAAQSYPLVNEVKLVCHTDGKVFGGFVEMEKWKKGVDSPSQT